MKKTILLPAVLALFFSCASTNSATVAVGESKSKVLKTLGNPVRTLDNNQNGEILVYADQVFDKDNSEGSQIAGSHYWRYNYVYVNKEGKVTSTRQEKQNYPPQAIDSVKMEGLNLLTSK
ncbi:hypothetical protein [Flavobacterium tistrianum]|uniref:hypothetical protein n=1 Tax=Flavobacterium tistrianum TaxID=1685414 RepID=UPI000DAD8A93|nr:hypothetical protein [Flavobacterium tistrianum]KAF2341517.1 hypothetical protein DMB71_08715 [Flavobacterium tistrianum]